MRQIYKFGLNPPRFLKISFTFPAKLHFKSSGRLPAILQQAFRTLGNPLAILQRPFRSS